jgi:SAM-dependent methyltransferase
LSLVDESDPVLDVGCGTGALLTELQKTRLAYGADLSLKALAYARERGLKNLVQADAQALPYTDNSFAACVSLDVIEHVPDDHAAVREICRVLRPGGRAVINVPAFRWLWGPHDVALMHERRYTKTELKQLLESEGLVVDKVSYGVFFLFPIVILVRLLEKLKSKNEVSIPQVPDWANRMLIRLMEWEAKLIQRVSLPWGSSVVASAHKPGA